jgi:tetratricopeptide (TPR) repeat protein
VTLLPADAPSRAGGTTSGVAYDLNQQGRFEWSRREPEALLQALRLFHQAVAADSNYAWAHVGLADTYNMLGSHDYGVLPPDSAFPAARRSALRALQLAPDLAPAHAALANVKANYDWDWNGAEAGYRRAIDLNPGYTPSGEWLASLLIARGRMSEALQLLRRVVEYNPSSALALTDLAQYYYYTRDLQRAHEYADRALATDPSFGRAHILHALVLCQGGLADKTVPWLEQVAAARGSADPILIALLGYAYARAGRPKDARGQLNALQVLRRDRYVPIEYDVPAQVALGDHADAIRALENALRSHSTSIIHLRAEPLVDPLRAMGGFQDIIDQLPGS